MIYVALIQAKHTCGHGEADGPHDAEVKAVLEKSAFGLIVLGGSHDLSDSVRRLGNGKCEYLRITTRRFKEFSK